MIDKDIEKDLEEIIRKDIKNITNESELLKEKQTYLQLTKLVFEKNMFNAKGDSEREKSAIHTNEVAIQLIKRVFLEKSKS